MRIDSLEKLANALGVLLEGESHHNVAVVCSMMINFCLNQIPEAEKVLTHKMVISNINRKPKAGMEPDEAQIVEDLNKMKSACLDFANRKITRLECKKYLLEECKVADYNLELLLDAYEPRH